MPQLQLVRGPADGLTVDAVPSSAGVVFVRVTEPTPGERQVEVLPRDTPLIVDLRADGWAPYVLRWGEWIHKPWRGQATGSIRRRA